MRWMVLLVVCFVFLSWGIALSAAYHLLTLPQQAKPLLKVLGNHPSDCSGLDLEETSECLRQELKGFYYYNLSNWEIDLTLEELKEQGGVCWHYSNWYAKRTEELGFDIEEIVIQKGEERHQFAVISDDNGYCILDQTFEPKCQELGVSLNETD